MTAERYVVACWDFGSSHAPEVVLGPFQDRGRAEAVADKLTRRVGAEDGGAFVVVPLCRRGVSFAELTRDYLIDCREGAL